MIICQFFDYLVLKPTFDFQTKRNLKSEDFPEILFCPKPSTDMTALNSRGYKTKANYYWGINSFLDEQLKNQIGWSGNKSEAPKMVFEDISTLKSEEDCPWGLVWNKYISLAVEFKLTRALYPNHMCCKLIIINNTESEVMFAVQIEKLNLKNKSFDSFKIIMADQAISYFHQHKIEMMGDVIVPNPQGVNIYQISLIEKEYIEKDPKYPCLNYKQNFEYRECIEQEILRQSLKLLNCTPPWITDNEDLWCIRGIDYKSSAQYNDFYNFVEEVTNSQANTENCLAPCIIRKYQVKLLGVEETDNGQGILLYFDKNVDVTKSSLQISFIKIMSEIGGSIGIGKNLLWLIILLISTITVCVSKLKLKVFSFE